jgi:hypothetical protein
VRDSHGVVLAKARYFPVSARPLKMAAGLARFGADFGQGEQDRRFFQRDHERPEYLRHKRIAPPERHVMPLDSQDHAVRSAALAWMHATLAQEAPDMLDDARRDAGARDEFDALARAIQEDFCVLSAGREFAGRVSVLDVRFPSGWRPDRLANADFLGIHQPVPGFPGGAAAAQSMVKSMVERGPFVRFLWTLSPDDQLDHHPDAGGASWDDPRGVWLRVERQVTVPLPAVQASVFLIRTYRYAARELTQEQRARLLTALERTSREVRTYKRLPESAQLAELLRADCG